MADLNDNADGYWNLKVGIEMKRRCCTTSTEIIFISTCYRAPPPFRYFFPFTAGKIFAMGKEVRFGFPYSYFMFETPAPAGNARYYIAPLLLVFTTGRKSFVFPRRAKSEATNDPYFEPLTVTGRREELTAI